MGLFGRIHRPAAIYFGLIVHREASVIRRSILPRAISYFVCLLLALTATSLAQSQPTDRDIYERFREWVTRQPPAPARQTSGTAKQPDLLTQYRDALRAKGVAPPEIDRQIRVINEQGRVLEIERWNVILTSPKPAFNTSPNAFLMQIAKRRTPGTALDVGMGQGRNAIYLAQQGWTVTGFDPAERAVSAAREQAKRLGVQLDARVAEDSTFDWGKDKWDLVLLSYVGVRQMAPRVIESLRPGGMVVVEAFHRDATKTSSIGGGVVFDTNELLTIFQSLRVLHYEDAKAVGDFGGTTETRVVRLAAEKM